MADAGSGRVVEREMRIDAPRERVWSLLTDPSQMERWMPVVRFEARLGGEMLFQAGEWVAFGEVTELDPPNRISYSWDWRNAPIGAQTHVTWELQEDGDGTLVRLRHTGFPTGEQADSHAKGWAHYAARLATVARGGDPGPDTMVS